MAKISTSNANEGSYLIDMTEAGERWGKAPRPFKGEAGGGSI